jgi:hypothetical protein
MTIKDWRSNGTFTAHLLVSVAIAGKSSLKDSHNPRLRMKYWKINPFEAILALGIGRNRRFDSIDVKGLSLNSSVETCFSQEHGTSD